MGKFFRVEIPAARGGFPLMGMEFLLLCAALLLVKLCENINHLTTAIVAAVRANGVRERRLVAMRAERNAHTRKGVMGAALARRGFRMPHADYHGRGGEELGIAKGSGNRGSCDKSNNIRK